MLLRAFAILNGKLRTAMQTAKAHHALVLNPDRSLVLYFNGLHGTFSGAQTTPDTSILYAEMSCAPYLAVIDWLCNPFRDKRRGTG